MECLNSSIDHEIFALYFTFYGSFFLQPWNNLVVSSMILKNAKIIQTILKKIVKYFFKPSSISSVSLHEKICLQCLQK